MDTKTLAQINGIARSVTMWAAGILIALGQFAPLVNEQTLVSLGLHGRSLQIALTISGLLMAACRMITTKSLASKGGLVAVVTPTDAVPQNAIIQKPAEPAPIVDATVIPATPVPPQPTSGV